MERISRFRAGILLLLFCAVLCFYGWRMYDMQVLATDTIASSDGTYTILTRVKADRGDILDRNGNELVTNRASYNLVFNNFVFDSSPNKNDALLRLIETCDQIGIVYDDHFPVSASQPYCYEFDRISDSWKDYFKAYLSNRSLDSDITAPLLMKELRRSYKIPEEWEEEQARRVIGLRFELALRSGITNLSSYVLVEDATEEELSAILELNIPGLSVETSSVREYATKYAAHILGYTGAMSPEEWEVYQKEDYSMDAYVGRAGFEKAFEEYLHGTDGWLEQTIDSSGNIIAEHYRTAPQAGCNVESTIDLNLQQVAEDELEKAILELRANGISEGSKDGKDAQGGAVVVQKVKTGEVLACASYPTYDLNTFSAKYNEILQQQYQPLYNRALQATYPPGSVYKMSMTVAGIDSGVINRNTAIEDKGLFTKYSGLSLACLAWTQRRTTHGMVTAAEALKYSCNYFFYVLGDMISLEAMDSTAAGLGLGEETGIELPEEIGRRANQETKAELYDGSEGEWYRADQITAAIGQSENRFTPLQLCVYTSALANQGTRYRATFLSRVVSTDYRSLIYENTPKVMSKLDISQEAYEAYVEGMRLAVTGGTAYTYFGNYDIPVCAKTGTASHGSGGSDHGSFVCFAPMEDPEIAISIYVEKGAQGGNLGKIARAIMDVYFAGQDAGDVAVYENRIS